MCRDRDASASKVKNWYHLLLGISRGGLFSFFLGCSGYSITNLLFSFVVTVDVIAVCVVLVVATTCAR